MKKLLIAAILLLHMLLPNYADDDQFLLSLSGPDIARVGYIHEGKQSTNLLLINEKGKVVFEEEIEDGKHFFKFLNISELKDGNYFFKLEDRNDYLGKAMVIKDSNASIVDIGTSKPQITLADKQVLINYHNKKRNVIKCMVIHNNDIILEEYFESELIHHRFDLSQYPVEKCSVLVRSGTNTYEIALAEL